VRRMVGRVMACLWVSAASGVACDKSSESAMVACGQESPIEAQEECRFQVALRLGPNRDVMRAALRDISDDISRDLVRIRLAVHDPIAHGWLCADTVVPEIQQQCTIIIYRPHLTHPQAPGPDK